jgi:putative integral membrane protein (TIGR02587 family)
MNSQQIMAEQSEEAVRARQDDAQRRFWRGLARAFGGAIIFALPMLMTMEMWHLGFHIEPLRLALLLALGVPLLVGLAWFSGFRRTFRLRDDVADAFVAYGVGFTASALLLGLFAVLHSGMRLDAMVGAVALQALPAAIGALLARSQFGEAREEEERKKRQAGYGGEFFLMVAGALYLAFNVAPTEEMMLIGFQMSIWQAVALAVLSLLIMHGFVYAVEFSGQHSAPPGTRWWSLFLRFTVAGYALALLISLYALWTFGRVEGLSVEMVLMMTVVLGFPAAVGAAAARLII